MHVDTQVCIIVPFNTRNYSIKSLLIFHVAANGCFIWTGGLSGDWQLNGDGAM